MKPEETVDFNIRSTWHKIARMYNSEAARHDITLAIGQVLLNIDARSGTPSTKLGPKMGMEPTSLSRLLKSMEERGYIIRKADERDKRLVRICITDLGKKKRDISKKTVLRFNNAVQESIAKEKLDHFFEVIDTISDILDKEELN